MGTNRDHVSRNERGEGVEKHQSPGEVGASPGRRVTFGDPYGESEPSVGVETSITTGIEPRCVECGCLLAAWETDAAHAALLCGPTGMDEELSKLVRWSTAPAIPGELFRSAVSAYCDRWAGFVGELPEGVVLRAVEGW